MGKKEDAARQLFLKFHHFKIAQINFRFESRSIFVKEMDKVIDLFGISKEDLANIFFSVLLGLKLIETQACGFVPKDALFQSFKPVQHRGTTFSC